MATESIGALIPTAIPGYTDSADIQAALRAYHYGSYSYDPANTSPASLITPSIAKTIYDLQQADLSVVTLNGVQTLTNKTLTSPTVSGLYISDSSITIEGASTNTNQTILTVVDPTQDNTATFPNTSGNVVLDTASQTLTNKTLTSPILTTPSIGVATGTSFNSITGLSSTNPAALGAVAVGTGTTTARADHVHPTTGLGLTSGTLAQFAATTSAQLAGVISDETGSGALVFATSPTLVTPSIGVATGTSFNSITGLSSTTPIVDGVAAVGTGTTTARADHVHPTDTSRAATSGTLAQFAATTSAQLAGVISDETGSGALVFGTGPTMTLPIINNYKTGYTTTATAAGTTTLTSASNKIQMFTGTTTQTLVLPVTSTLATGVQYDIHNNSTGSVTVQSSGLNTVITLAAGDTAVVTCINTALTTAAAWDVDTVSTSPTTYSAGNGLTLTGSVFSINTSITADLSTAQTFTNKTINLSNNTLTATSAQIASAVTDETGSGALVFATSPTLTTPVLGAATGTSLALTGGSLTARPAATQDAIVISGRAGGTSSFGVTITPTTLTASRTVTFPDVTGTVALMSQVINNTLTTTTGDMIYASSNNTPARLAVGSEGTVLKVVSGTPTWSAAPAAIAEIFMLGGM